MSTLGLDNDGGNSSASPAELKAVVSQANTILIVSAVSILFCCLGGLIATYYAYQGKQDALAGNADSASRNIGIAKGWMIATYVIGILSIIGRLIGSGR